MRIYKRFHGLQIFSTGKFNCDGLICKVKCATRYAKLGTKRLYTLHKFCKDCNFVRLVAFFDPNINPVIGDATSSRLRRITCSKQSTVMVSNRCSLNLGATLGLRGSFRNFRTQPICFCEY